MLVSIPNKIERKKTLKKMNKYFPSIDAHKYITIIAIQMAIIMFDEINILQINIVNNYKNSNRMIKKIIRFVKWIDQLNDDKTGIIEKLAISHVAKLIDMMMHNESDNDYNDDSDDGFTVESKYIPLLLCWSSGYSIELVNNKLNKQEAISIEPSLSSSVTPSLASHLGSTPSRIDHGYTKYNDMELIHEVNNIKSFKRVTEKETIQKKGEFDGDDSDNVLDYTHIYSNSNDNVMYRNINSFLEKNKSYHTDSVNESDKLNDHIADRNSCTRSVRSNFINTRVEELEKKLSLERRNRVMIETRLKEIESTKDIHNDNAHTQNQNHHNHMHQNNRNLLELKLQQHSLASSVSCSVNNDHYHEHSGNNIVQHEVVLLMIAKQDDLLHQLISEIELLKENNNVASSITTNVDKASSPSTNGSSISYVFHSSTMLQKSNEKNINYDYAHVNCGCMVQ